MTIRTDRQTGVRSKALLASKFRVEQLEARAYFAIGFEAPVTIALPAAIGLAQRPIAGDFNNDGKNDVVLPICSQQQGGPAGVVLLATGNGDGTFNTPTQAFSTIFNFEAAKGDFNGDGNLDLMVSDFGADLIRVHTGNGDGTFDAEQTFATGDGPFYMGVGDFNNDGRDDVAVGNRSSDNLTVRLGDASTALGAAATVATSNDPVGVLVADFNGDDKLDILTADGTTGPITALAGNGDGTFTAVANVPGLAAAVAAADFNNDGKTDLFRGITNAGTPVVTLGNGDLTFATTAINEAVNQATPGDADGDGKVDLFFAGTSDAFDTFVFPGRSDGTFDAPLNVTLPTAGLGRPADLNGDGLSDMFFLNASTAGEFSLTTVLAKNSRPNLVPTIVSNPPSSVIGGAKGILLVRLTNAGAGTFKGSTDIRLTASLDATADAGDGEIFTVTQAATIRAGKSKVVKVKFVYPTSLPAADYYLLAEVDPAGTAAEAPKTDNVAASPNQVTIAPAFIDLAATLPTPIAASYTIGKKGRLTLTLQNLGNELMKGSATIALISSVDGTLDDGDLAFAAPVAKFVIKPGATRNQRVVFDVPEGLAAGSSNLFITVTPTTFTDADLANNTVLAAQPFVVA